MSIASAAIQRWWVERTPRTNAAMAAQALTTASALVSERRGRAALRLA